MEICPVRGYLFIESQLKSNLLRRSYPYQTMPNTYSQLYIHFVFAVKYRDAAINILWEERLHTYITGIIQNNSHKLLAINSMPDHIHVLVGLNPRQSISELMRLVKCDSSEFINKEKLVLGKFQWQDGYGAFSHSHSQIDSVIKYIINQKQHHHRKTFREEYTDMLKSFAVDYNEQYIFKDLID